MTKTDSKSNFEWPMFDVGFDWFNERFTDSKLLVVIHNFQNQFTGHAQLSTYSHSLQHTIHSTDLRLATQAKCRAMLTLKYY